MNVTIRPPEGGQSQERAQEGVLPLAREVGSPYLVAVCLGGLGALAAATGRHDEAARLVGAAEAMLDAAGSSLEPSDPIPSRPGATRALTWTSPARWRWRR